MGLDIEEVAEMLKKRGIRINRATKEINATRPKAGVLGIDTLGKLTFMMSHGYTVLKPINKFYSVR